MDILEGRAYARSHELVQSVKGDESKLPKGNRMVDLAMDFMFEDAAVEIAKKKAARKAKQEAQIAKEQERASGRVEDRRGSGGVRQTA